MCVCVCVCVDTGVPVCATSDGEVTFEPRAEEMRA